eukprot:2819982-Amphidinium_carterae.1
MERCRASLVLLSISSGTQVQVTSVHCPYLMELETTTSSFQLDNTSEPATVLSMHQSLGVFGMVDAFAQWCPTIDVCVSLLLPSIQFG